jgi:outer membrane protein assembly factor BamB
MLPEKMERSQAAKEDFPSMQSISPASRRLAALAASLTLCTAAALGADKTFDPVAEAREAIARMKVRPTDWPQWGGSPSRNNTPDATGIPTQWDIEKGVNIKWVASLGSQSYGNPVIANGKVYVGTNNGSGYIKRYAPTVDLGVLLCFEEATGKLLWQDSSEKLPTGRVHDWPLQGICCAPLVEGDRLWYVTSRGEVTCLDTEGFLDGENDGPFTTEKHQESIEADVVWRVDMMKQLGLSQHNMCSCSVTAAGDVLFVITGNGVDEGHVNIPAPNAPSFLALRRSTGEVLWSDNSPGINVLHGQWSSPAYGVLGGVPQVLFAGGDGWLYSFLAEATPDKKAQMLWKFDANPKESKYILGAKADRNHLIGTPVIYDGHVFIGVGEDPEHGEGVGHLYRIDPTKRGDVSPTLAFNRRNPKTPIPHKRNQAVEADLGDFSAPNPNSAMVWHFGHEPGKPRASDPCEDMHRTCGTATIKDDLLYIADFSGYFHCLDARTGKQLWCYDMLSACWASALVVDGHVFIGDEDGDVAIFKHSRKMELVSEINMGNSVYTTPVVAGGVLYIANRTKLFAIQAPAK